MQRVEHDIQKRLAVVNLPAMPQVLLRLMALCQSQQPDAEEAARLVSLDPGMACTLLGLAHGAPGGAKDRNIGIARVLDGLGEEMFRALVVNESVKRSFDGGAADGDLRAFWQRSLVAAHAARALAAEISYPYPEEAYLAGLLHDIGRLALLAVAPAEYAEEFHARDDVNLCWREQRAFQITHGEAGAALVERWRQDSFLADGILYHHEPPARLDGAHPLIRLTMLAHLLANYPPDHADTVLAAAPDAQLTPKVLSRIHADAQEQVKQIAAGLEIDLDDVVLLAPKAAEGKARRQRAQTEVEEGKPALAKDLLQESLTHEMRNMLLTGNAERILMRLPAEDDLAAAVARLSGMLFHFDDVILLMREAGVLRGSDAGATRQRLAGFTIPLDKEGAISRAAADHKVAFVQREGSLLEVWEEQLLGMFGAECLVCLPLVAQEHCIGMLIGAASQQRIAQLSWNGGFLQAYAAQAAQALQAAQRERLIRSDQAASIAEEYKEASRRVAHEVNNPLSIIKNYLSILNDKLQKNQPVGSELSILNEEIDRVGQIVQGLSGLQLLTPPGSTDLGRVVREVVRLFTETEFASQSVRIASHFPRAPSVVAGNADLLKQILFNLIKNAVEAMPGGGAIDITDHGPVNRDGRLYAELWIQDNGPGIPAEVLADLFVAGRSTKGESRGLGLSIVHSLVVKLHGTIVCRSNTQGTVFQLLLPLPDPASLSKTEQRG